MIFECSYPRIEIPNITFQRYLFSEIKKYEDSVSLIDNDRHGISMTFGELHHKAKCLGTFLHNEGIGIGDMVALCVTSCNEFPVVMMGIIASGATFTPCNPEYSEDKIFHEFNISQPKIIFVNEEMLETMKKVVTRISCVQKIIVVGKSNEYLTYDKVIDCLPDDDALEKIDNSTTPDSDIAILPYSSGTTGLPKGVIQTHKYLIANCLLWGHSYHHTNDDVLYLERPMFYMSGFITLMYAFQRGTTVVFENKFQLESMLKAVEKYKITQTVTVPFVMMALLDTKLYNDYDMSSFKTLSTGGDNIAPTILKEFMTLRKVDVIIDYGLTELNPIAMGEVSNGSTGKICPNTSVKIIDLKTGEELGVGDQGEILAKGPQITPGYFKNPNATAKAIDEDGWFHTGDIGFLDADGYLYIVGRIKELIKYKSIPIPPAEIQNVLLQHPKIKDAAIIGVPHPVLGDLPKAFVVRTDDSLHADEVTKFVEDRMGDENRLRGGVQFLQEIPKNVFGKIERRELNKMS